MSKILIIRFSALGDVAMTIPVIQSMVVAFPMHEISVLSSSTLEPLFDYLPNVRFIGADLKNKHKGISGLETLFDELKDEKFDYVADFHSVIRSNYLRFRFTLNGAKTASIHKGRLEKKRLTRKNDKCLIPLKSSFERYHNVLQELGFHFDLQFKSLFKEEPDFEQIKPLTGEKGDMKWLGIAPFAKHKGKIYPLELQEKVIARFARQDDVKVFVFGGGDTEKNIVLKWVEKYPSIISMVGKLTMNQELILMNKLNLMVSMDSANMHFASLVNTKVLSIWGATHPYAGFMGWNQKNENAIQVDLSCRPCSVYGQKPCFRNDYACLNSINPEVISNKIDNLLRSDENNN